MKKIANEAAPFVKYALFIWIALGGCYDLYFKSFSRYVDKFCFIIVYFIFCAVFQCYLEKKQEIQKSPYGKLLVNGIIVEAYFVTLFAQYYFAVVVLILCALILVYVWLYKLTVLDDPKTAKRAVEKKRCERLQLLVCGVAVIALLVPSGIGIYEEYFSPSVTTEEWSAFVDAFNADTDNKSEETLFEKHGETLKKLNQWETLDNKSRIDLIYKIGLIELENLGISKEAGIKIQSDKIDEYTLGYYLDSEKLIVINIDHICGDDIEKNISTIAHEAYHAYQHYVVNLLDFDSEFVLNSFYFEQARGWKDNIENYISADFNFEKYQSQPLEADADEYAEQRAKEYMLAAYY